MDSTNLDPKSIFTDLLVGVEVLKARARHHRNLACRHYEMSEVSAAEKENAFADGIEHALKVLELTE